MWMPLKCKWQLSNDLLQVHTLLLIDVGVRIVISHWLQRGHVSQVHAPFYARCGRAAAGARKYPSLQRRTAARPYSRGAGSVERTPKRRWTEWDRSELAEPGPPWTPSHMPSNHRPSSGCCPGWVFFFFSPLRCCIWCVSVREGVCVWGGGGLLRCRCVSPVTSSHRKYGSQESCDNWCAGCANLLAMRCDCIRKYAWGWNHKGPAVIRNPDWNCSYYRSI